MTNNTPSGAKKHRKSTEPESHAWDQGHTICNHSLWIPFYSRPGDFPLAAKQTTTFSNSVNANIIILSALTNALSGGYEVISCSSMEPGTGTTKLVTFKKHFWRW